LQSKLLAKLFPSFFTKKDQQYGDIVDLIGYRPKNYWLFKTALRHSSVIYTKKLDLESNERLEFLGDAVLDMVVSERLYEDFPDKNEGELTKLRVKLVNRNFLNDVSIRIGIPKLLHQYVGKKKDLIKNKHNIYGNALESLIGAVYIDGGLQKAREFVETKVFCGEDEYDSILSKDKDYKSRLVSWSQKEGHKIDFIDELSTERNGFEVIVKIGEVFYGRGVGRRKKQAHQKAAETTIELLEKKGYEIEEL